MTNSLPKAILVDMDDTILSSGGRSSDECWLATCNSFATRLETHTPEEIFSAIRDYANWYWGDPERHRQGRLRLNAARREIVEGAFSRLGIDDPALAKEIARSYSTRRRRDIRPFPGAIETLHRLREHGSLLALVTNGNARLQRNKIARFKLAPCFDYILVEGEFGVGKPDERVYLHVLDRLKVTAAEAWMVGDNLEWDVLAPQRVGIFGIWLNPTGVCLPEGCAARPNRTIRALPEIL